MRHRALLGLGLAAALAGCSMAPAAKPPEPVEELPDTFEQVSIPGDYAPAGWWSSFQDPTLDTLLAEALVENLDLQEAVARVTESRALLGIATAPLLPSATVTGSVTQNSSPNNTGFGRQIFELLSGAAGDSTDAGDGNGDGNGNGDGDGDGEEPEGPPDRFTNTIYSLSIGFAYELDFWGRLRNDRSAAAADLAASEADLHTARLSVLAEVITAYFEYVDLRGRVELTEEIVSVLEERTALTEDRYDRGLVTSFELYQVRQDLRTTQAGLPQLRTQLADVERRLALATGRYPTEVRELIERTTPTLHPGSIPAGLPSDLLLQRPQ